MFSRLRNRFMILNMVIISCMMLVAFAAIYTITYQNVRSDTDMELHGVAEFYHKQGGGGPGDNHKGGGGGGRGGMPSPGGDGSPPPMNGSGSGSPLPDRSVSFLLQTDGDWTIKATISRFDMDADFYALAAKKAAAGRSDIGRFTLEGNRWAYLVLNNGSGHDIVYLDVTAQQTILRNLVYTFLAVGLAMLIVIFFTSRYFANRSIAPVKDAFDKQKRFIADASHELKTPLAVINTHADVLLANSDDPIREQAKWLHHIKSETERMKTLTGDLLYLTEMDDSRERMIYAPFDASEAVESVILTMEAVIFEKQISLSYEIEPGLTVRGSSEQIKQVVMILLDNAVKYANAEGSIALKMSRRHHDVQLAVTNTGEGIAAEHLERIFDRFYRIDASRSRKKGGYGLGLAIAKSIVEQHKGRISARSVPRESTTFLVQLPLSAGK
ncbi:sensor histidine kinase [Paenibacillus sacheonensis]|uniref:histidine kinase n=1 Tax=Paenibacillus sacheonensis TaxID=742054 RepID=A0A7X4YTT0_9BACL|nr:HAMP domain-containing sensor histidine kinase [Paenibacillus sacheonensis]MBM7568563.1 signal transduction histidine kinase [Paenibacillus sacheonensis]NBC72385.1 GHKL domain-containing protein [Paenibacillus sacheonensis]